MIKLTHQGHYKLIETKGQTKVLYLNPDSTSLQTKNVYAWVNVSDIGEILITSTNPHKTDYILSLGRYRIYQVKDEPKLTDLTHLELFVGEGLWQGYLLPTGMPNLKERKKLIIPTHEVITKSIY